MNFNEIYNLALKCRLGIILLSWGGGGGGLLLQRNFLELGARFLRQLVLQKSAQQQFHPKYWFLQKTISIFYFFFFFGWFITLLALKSFPIGCNLSRFFKKFSTLGSTPRILFRLPLHALPSVSIGLAAGFDTSTASAAEPWQPAARAASAGGLLLASSLSPSAAGFSLEPFSSSSSPSWKSDWSHQCKVISMAQWIRSEWKNYGLKLSYRKKRPSEKVFQLIHLIIKKADEAQGAFLCKVSTGLITPVPCRQPHCMK